MTRKTRTLSLLVPLALLLLVHPAALRADPVDDFQRLDQQCWEQIGAGNLREAKRLALEMKRMANGPLANDPECLADALTTLGAVYDEQNRYAEAEPLHKRALAILAGRRVLHFACHGLVDQSYGNLFGALAFTPGPNADDPLDDGFLTLAEALHQAKRWCRSQEKWKSPYYWSTFVLVGPH